MKIILKTVIDLDRESYNREYQDDSETESEITEFMRDSVDWNLRDFVKRWPYIRSISVTREN